jgi:hypothetical protein
MRALFILAAGLAFLSMLLALKWVPEPEEKVDRAEINSTLSKVPLFTFERARYMPQRIVHVLKISTENLKIENFPKDLRRYYVFTFVIFTGFLTFYVALPIYLKQYVGMSSADVFIIYVASSAVSAITYSQAGKWATRFGSKRLQAGGHHRPGLPLPGLLPGDPPEPAVRPAAGGVLRAPRAAGLLLGQHLGGREPHRVEHLQAGLPGRVHRDVQRHAGHGDGGRRADRRVHRAVPRLRGGVLHFVYFPGGRPGAASENKY